MTSADDVLATPAGPPRDGRGRYLMADESGQVAPRTRVTTFAEAMSDTFSLTAWKQRVTARGMALRPDLCAVAAATPADDKVAYREIVDSAFDAGGGNTSARMGTAFHALAQQAASGDATLNYETVPESLRPMLSAYFAELGRLGIREQPELMERSVYCATYDVGGTFDRIYRLPEPCTLCRSLLVIGDIKTGATLAYSEREIAIQLAVYANSDIMFERGSAERFEPMPLVCRHFALVAHVPQGLAECHIERIDISRGWAAARLAAEVRSWRGTKHLRTPYIPPADESADRHVRPGNEPWIKSSVTPMAVKNFADTANNPPTYEPLARDLIGRSVSPAQETTATALAEQGVEMLAKAAKMTLTDQQGEPPIDPDTEAAELFSHMKKSKPKIQELARQMMAASPGRDIKLNQYAIKIAGEIVRHPAWPGFRGRIMGTVPSTNVAPPTPSRDEPPSVPELSPQAQAITNNIAAIKEQFDWASQEPQTNPFEIQQPVRDEAFYIAAIKDAPSKAALAQLWQNAQADGVIWSDMLNRAGLARMNEIGAL